MKSALVGYTGFVGSNLSYTNEFTYKYNSKNIEQAFGTRPDLLVYAGVRAEKFLANNDPHQDMLLIEEAYDNIFRINPKKLVLVSTVDVYKNPVGVDEDSDIIIEGLQPYGADRLLLEKKVRERWPEALVVRLPGLYGTNIKKNFIYDFIHIIPTLLKQEKFLELSEKELILNKFYYRLDNSFYKCKVLTASEEKTLKNIFMKLGFSALNFTDSRSKFQFYGLHHLWGHIEKAMMKDLNVLNIATEPIEIKELYHHLTGLSFENYISQSPPTYDFRTKFDSLYSGKDGYIFEKQFILNEITTFIQKYNVSV